jgi:DNA repair protein RadC
VSERKMRTTSKIKTPEDIYALVKRYANARQEHFIVITLNQNLEPISVNIVTIGLVNRTIVHPREVFYRAVKDMASNVIVCHNHPSGKTEPSEEDLAITKRLCEAGELLGIKLLDHIIITKTGYYSFTKNGDIPNEVKGGFDELN